MILKILNKTNFTQKFLIPISRINDICTLTIENGVIYNLNRTSDTNFSLYSVCTDVDAVEITEKRNLSFADIKKFIKVFDCIQSDTVELKLNDNNVEYKSEGTKFKFHLINDNIVKSPNFNIQKINALEYDLNFKMPSSALNILLKSSTFITDSNKIYISTENGNVIAELNDKTKSNIDSFATKLSDSYSGNSLNKALAFDFDLFRNISFLKTQEIDIKINTIKGVIAFDIVEDKYKLKYISTAKVS